MDNTKNRIIKLLLPTNNIINIQMIGDENETKSLISTLIDCSPDQIKGLKDSFGNYYTFSSAMKSENLVIENNIFELIYSQKRKNSIDSNNQGTNKLSSSYDGHIKNNIILNSNPNVGNYYANYYINNNNNVRNSMERINKNINNSISNIFIEKHKNNEIIFKNRNYSVNSYKDKNIQNINKNTNNNKIQVYHSFLNQIFNEKLIDINKYTVFNNLLKNNNLEILNLFEIFLNDIINKNELVHNLNLIYEKKFKSKNIKIKLNTMFPLNQENELGDKLIEKDNNLDESYKEVMYKKLLEIELFRNESEIIRQLIKYENEYMINALKNYKKNNDFNFLKTEVQNAIIRYKNKISLHKPYSNKNLVNNINVSTNIQRFEKRHNSSPQGSHNEIKPKIMKNENKGHYQIFDNLNQNNQNNNKKDKNKKISNKIKNDIKLKLNKFNKIIFDFIILNQNDLILKLNEIYKSKENKIKINENLNLEIQNFIIKELVNYIKVNNFKIEEKYINETYNKLINNEKEDLFKIYKNFETNKDFNKFIKEIYFFINPIIFSKMNSISSNNSSLEEKINNIIDKSIKNFINDLSKLNLKEQDKEKIYNLIFVEKNEKILEIIKKFKNDENIHKFKDDIFIILKKKTNGTILDKLKNKNSPNKRQNSRPEQAKIKKNESNNIYNKIQNFNDCINILKKKNKFSLEQINFFEKEYANTDGMLKNIFETFIQNREFEDLINSLEIFYIKNGPKKKKINENNEVKDVTKTPDRICRKKNELGKMYEKGPKNEKELYEKQKEINRLLYEDKYYNKKTYDIVMEKLNEGDSRLLAIFEFYANTRNTQDFAETLQIFSNITESRYDILYKIINTQNFNKSQKNKIFKLYDQNEKDKDLMEILNSYKNQKNLEILGNEIKKLIKKK